MERNLYLIIRPLTSNPMIPILKEILTSKKLAYGIIHDHRFAFVPLTIKIGILFQEPFSAVEDINERIANWFYESFCEAMYSLTSSERRVSEWCNLVDRCVVDCSEKEASFSIGYTALFRNILAICTSNMLNESAQWPMQNGYRIKIDIHPAEVGGVANLAKFHSPAYSDLYQREFMKHPPIDVSSSRWMVACKSTGSKFYWQHPWEHFVNRLVKRPILSEEENPQDRVRRTVLPPRAPQ
jgi:hypothetical protein